MPEETKTPAAETQPQMPQFATDSSSLSTIYTNFCRVSITPEELVLDFGLNTSMTPNPAEPIKLTHRVVMNFYTSKRLLLALHDVVTRFENTYGALELEIARRQRSFPRPSAPGTGTGTGSGRGPG